MDRYGVSVPPLILDHVLKHELQLPGAHGLPGAVDDVAGWAGGVHYEAYHAGELTPGPPAWATSLLKEVEGCSLLALS